MANENEPPHLSTEDARAGSTPGVGRPVLVISLVAIILLFAGLLILYR